MEQLPVIYPAGTRVLVRTSKLKRGTVWKQNTPQNPYRIEVLLDDDAKPHIYNAYYVQPIPQREPKRKPLPKTRHTKRPSEKLTEYEK